VIVRIGNNRAFVEDALKEALPDVESALWFAKAFDFTAQERSSLFSVLFKNSDVIDALVNEGGEHSTELQDYLLELGYDQLIEEGAVKFSTDVPKGEVLPEVWESLQVVIAASIKEVCDALGDSIGRMPGKEGRMLMQSLMTVNAKRPIIGDFKARIKHQSQVPNLWILDVSGSMTETTVRKLVDEVVAGAYMANAHLAVVSDTTTFWGPGEYDSETVLNVAEFSGTHYETLAPLFEQDWGVVVTIADYDSSYRAHDAFAKVKGRVSEVFDISLVNQPTFLSEVIGDVADKVTPVLIARDNSCCMRSN
jgi:hypothetical protein